MPSAVLETNYDQWRRLVINLRCYQLAEVPARDPVAIKDPRRILGDGATDYQHPYQVAEAADALLLVTEWNESKQPSMERVKALMCQPVLLHGRNIHDPQPLRDLGFIYWEMGRRSSAGSKNAG